MGVGSRWEGNMTAWVFPAYLVWCVVIFTCFIEMRALHSPYVWLTPLACMQHSGRGTPVERSCMHPLLFMVLKKKKKRGSHSHGMSEGWGMYRYGPWRRRARDSLVTSQTPKLLLRPTTPRQQPPYYRRSFSSFFFIPAHTVLRVATSKQDYLATVRC